MENRIYEYLTVFVMSWLLVYGLTPFIMKLALRTNMVDKPNARKDHKKVTPLMGGLSVFIGFFLLCIYDVAISAGRYFDLPMMGYLAGSLLIVLIGLWDDKWPMNPYVKMLGQIAVALIFTLSNFTMNELNLMVGNAYITIFLMLLWMVGLMNALNFLDNMDGVLSGMAGILGLGFFAFSLTSTTQTNQEAMALIGLISLSFCGSVFGFLPYNFHPARMFLGDAGSMFIGYFLSSMGILMARLAGNRYNDKLFFLMPVLLLSFAIFDIVLVSYTRHRDGRHIMQGGLDHSTHRIRNVLKSVKLTALVVYAINVLIVLTAIIVFIIGSRKLLLATTALFIAFFIFFGHKLDQVPVVIPENQKKSNTR